jgi:hypothetical protein
MGVIVSGFFRQVESVSPPYNGYSIGLVVPDQPTSRALSNRVSHRTSECRLKVQVPAFPRGQQLCLS